MLKRKGRTMFFANAAVKCGYTVAGPKEQEGRYKDCFDETLSDDRCGEESFEKAERCMFKSAINGVIDKSEIESDDVEAVMGGDLLDQIVSTSFACRDLDKIFIGLYNACATFAESLAIGAMTVDGGYKTNVICIAGSHFSTAERQYRYPLELGVLRSPVSQWTITGVGATLLTSDLNPNGEKDALLSKKPHITAATFGRIVDYGLLDVNNMGAAMAPAAADTLIRFYRDSGKTAADYDVIATGDLGYLGMEIMEDIMTKRGFPFQNNYMDCGASMYYKTQQTYQGGSGAGASALVFNSDLFEKMKKGTLNRILLIGTGALMSPLTSFQGETIPCIAHLVEICN